MLDSCNPMDYSKSDSLSSTIFQSLLEFMSIELVIQSNHLILCHPLLLLLSIFPSISFFFFFSSPNELTLPIRWPKYWIGQSASASVLPMNIQGWLPLGLTGWSCRFDLTRDSQESSPAPQFGNISFSALSPLYGPTLTSVHNYWKNHSFA